MHKKILIIVMLLSVHALGAMELTENSDAETSSVSSSSSRPASIKLVPVPQIDVDVKALTEHPIATIGNLFFFSGGYPREAFSGLRKNALRQIQKLTSNYFHCKDSLRCAALSDDGSLLVVRLRADTNIYIHDVQSGALLYTFPHVDFVWSVALNRDGSLLATGCHDNNVRIFDVKSGTLLYELPHEHSVNRVEFNHDGSRLATRCRDMNACIFDAQSGTLLHTFSHDCGFCPVALSHDGSLVATIWDNKIRTFNVETGELLWELPFGDHCFNSMVFNDYGSLFILAKGPNEDDGFFDIDVLKEDYSFTEYTVNRAALNQDRLLGMLWENESIRIVDMQSTEYITDTLSIDQYLLLQAFAVAVQDSKKLEQENKARYQEKTPLKRTRMPTIARIHANANQWATWERLRALCLDKERGNSAQIIKRLEPYIVQHHVHSMQLRDFSSRR